MNLIEKLEKEIKDLADLDLQVKILEVICIMLYLH